MSKKAPALWWATITGTTVLVCGVLDWLMGYEMNFFVFFFLPVSVGAWFLGLGASIILIVFSALVWFGADVLSGYIYSSHVHAVWNTTIRLVSFLAIGWSVYKMRHAHDREHYTAVALRQALSEIKVLEAFFSICAQCKKIRNQQAERQKLETYISHHSNI
jgi:hypothetical protein